MWTVGWRDNIWQTLNQSWDLIIVGGGITGAGILREAARHGLKALLLEQHDFAAGTSSRSSKLVHGGLRYLKNAQFRLTYESVRQRERLMNEATGLVTPLSFLVVNYDRDQTPAWLYGAGLVVYDLLATRWSHHAYTPAALHGICPFLSDEGLEGGFIYIDAQTDDARLVLRVLREAVRAGGVVLNYARVEDVLRTTNGQVCGVAVRDMATEGAGRTLELRAGVVINAAGAWADDLRIKLGQPRRLRPLRGSHLIFEAHRLPLGQAISFMHPVDSRPVFAIPWEGVTIFGTTDADHGPQIEIDPIISPAEADYLMEALRVAFPALKLSEQDVIGSWAGVRPVVNTGQADPSKESREHVLWQENGLVTVTGGKLTTFRLMAQQALRAIRSELPDKLDLRREERMVDLVAAEITPFHLPLPAWVRLQGRYGADTPGLLAAAEPDELTPVERLPALWAELRWAARAEGVVHLDDLLLRRVRLGLTLPGGGLAHLARVRAIAQPELGWSDARWEAEEAAYRQLWQHAYAPPKSL